jgi:type IV pilus assembly protein PilV
MAMFTRSRRSRALPSRSHGFTLVEILVTLLIVSIGLLGIAALHAFSLRNNYDALLRSHASAMASDIVDRMRANIPAIRNGNTMLADSDYEVEFDVTPDLEDADSQATIDVAEWKLALAEQLPEGDGRIQINEATGVVTISVRWGERDEDAPVMTFTTETEI